MKKRYLILAGILAASMFAAGCGNKTSVAPEQKVEATATPAVTEAPKSDVVEMKTATDESILTDRNLRCKIKSRLVNTNRREISRERIKRIHYLTELNPKEEVL